MITIYQYGKSNDVSNVPWLSIINYRCNGGTTSINVNWAGWLIFAGIIFFSGSLYILVLTQIKVLGAITPIGGVLFIIGWIMLIIATFKFAG